jgi:hypothetical protein
MCRGGTEGPGPSHTSPPPTPFQWCPFVMCFMINYETCSVSCLSKSIDSRVDLREPQMIAFGQKHRRISLGLPWSSEGGVSWGPGPQPAGPMPAPGGQCENGVELDEASVDLCGKPTHWCQKGSVSWGVGGETEFGLFFPLHYQGS